jgi:hemin uptake protein HemP
MTIKVNNVIARKLVASGPRRDSGAHTFRGQQTKNGAQVMTTAADERHRAKANPETQESSDTKVRVLVAELLQGGREAVLEHDGQDYRLRITANGKLILTK